MHVGSWTGLLKLLQDEAVIRMLMAWLWVPQISWCGTHRAALQPLPFFVLHSLTDSLVGLGRWSILVHGMVIDHNSREDGRQSPHQTRPAKNS